MSEEGVAEKIYEAGIEVVNPGGRPDVLRSAADGWVAMGKELDELFDVLDRQVWYVVGENWRGESADAFCVHWEEVRKEVREIRHVFDEAASGLREAAKNIEEINDQIHAIYLEIGISVAASVALSFVTVGFSAAAGAANAARLAKNAVDAATKLGKILGTIAKMFRGIRGFAQKGKMQRGIVELGTQWAAGTGTGVVTSLASKGKPEVRENMVNGAFGALGGKFVAGPLGDVLGGGLAGKAVGGAVGGSAASLGGDSTNNLLDGKEFDGSQMALGAFTGGITGAAGGASTHRSTDGSGASGARELGTDVLTNSPISFGLGVEGNAAKDTDESVFGNPGADKAEDRPGDVANARDDMTENARNIKELPDTSKYGAFG